MPDAPTSEQKLAPSSPVLLILVATSFLACISFVAFSVLALNKQKDVLEAAAQAAKSAAAKEVPTLAASQPSREAQFYSNACPSGCSGGEACAASPKACSSGVQCLPGTASELITSDLRVSLSLSAIALVTEKDPCVYARDYWLCLRPSQGGQWSCASQAEACSQAVHGAARSSVILRTSGQTLLQDGVDLLIREGGPNGTALAQELHHIYPHGLRQSALCNGLKVNFEPGSLVKWVSFYLVPDAGTEAPGPGAAGAAEP